MLISLALRLIARAALLAPIAAAGTAHAQAVGPQVSLEASTDLRRSGLSWSGGDAALDLAGSLPVGRDLAIDVSAMTLRGSARHGGADAGVTVAPRYRLEAAGWSLAAGARGNLFLGRSGMNYIELTGDVERTLGPARLIAGAQFAPAQDAIGGHNLHLSADLSVGVPGLPITAFGGIGRTSGSSRDDARAWRLRPGGGSYTDWNAGVEYARRSLSAGLVYSDTSIEADAADRRSPFYDRHHGGRIVAFLRLSS